MTSIQSIKILLSIFCFFLGPKDVEASWFSVNCRHRFARMLPFVFLLCGFNSRHVIDFSGSNFSISTLHSLIRSCTVSNLLLSLVRLSVLMFFILLNTLSVSAELILWHKRKSTRWNKLLNPKLSTFLPILYHDLEGKSFCYDLPIVTILIFSFATRMELLPHRLPSWRTAPW